MRRMSAPDCLITSCGAVTLPSDFDILRPVLVEHEAVREHDVEGRAAARAAAFKQRGLEPAAMLVGAFEIHHGVVAAVGLALDAGEARKMHRVFQHEGVRRAGIEPDVENVVDLLPVFVGALAEEALARAGLCTRRRRPPASKASTMRTLTSGSSRMSTEPSGFSLMNTRDRHAPGALARDHPVGPALDHAVDAVLALRRHPARRP